MFALCLKNCKTAFAATSQGVTVLAPSDEAMRRLPPALRDKLLSGKDAALLEQFVRSHILPDSRTSVQLRMLVEVTSQRDVRLHVGKETPQTWIGPSQIITPDLTSSEGTIQIVDCVLPLSNQDVGAVLKSFGAETMASLLRAYRDSKTMFTSDKPVTVLALTDEMFGALPKGFADRLKLPGHEAELAAFIESQVIRGPEWSSEFVAGKNIAMFGGTTQRISGQDGAVSVGSARIIKGDVPFVSGVIHFVDQPVVPVK